MNCHRIRLLRFLNSSTWWVMACLLLVYVAQLGLFVFVYHPINPYHGYDPSFPTVPLDSWRRDKTKLLLQKAQPIIMGHRLDLQTEIENSRQYVQTIQDTTRRLIFVHIPKAAGTTIEEIGGKSPAKLSWGSCRFNHRPKRPGNVCRYPPGQFEWPMKIGYWHLPTQFFPLLGINPYDGADLFAVVREPHDRLLSEFYYICRRKKSKWWDAIDCNQSKVHDPHYLNEWMQDKLLHVGTNRSLAKAYLDHNGHYTPQYDFVINTNGNVRMIDHVLRMTDLQTEFPRLMKAYGLPVTMPVVKKNMARNDTRDLDIRHLTAETRRLIYQRYQRDFDLLDGKLPIT